MIFFLAEQPMEEEALLAIAVVQEADELFVSPITAWEVALLLEKPADRQPDLKGQGAEDWFENGRRLMGLRLATITLPVSLEAARIPGRCGHKDPADCFIMATGQIRGLAVVTRDATMRRLSDEGTYPGLTIIPC